jgi:hypothetical protein
MYVHFYLNNLQAFWNLQIIKFIKAGLRSTMTQQVQWLHCFIWLQCDPETISAESLFHRSLNLSISSTCCIVSCCSWP